MQSNAYGTEFLILLLFVVGVVIVLYYIGKFRKKGSESNHYLEALEFLADGDGKKAIQKFKEAVKDDTDNIQAYLRLGNLLRERGMVKNALKIHKDLTLRGNLDAGLKGQIDKSLMIDYELAGDFKNAAAIAKKMVDDSGDLQIVEKLLLYFEKEQEWESANELYRSHFKKLDESIKSRAALYLIFIGLDLIKEERGKEARIKFKEALKLDPACPAAPYYLGHSYYLENRISEAIDFWKKLAINDPQNGYIVYKDLERSWFDLGKFSESEKLYRQIISRDRENFYAIQALCEIYNKKGDYDAALEILNEMDSEKEELSILKSKILFNKGQYKNSAAQALEILEKSPVKLDHPHACKVCGNSVKEMRWYCPGCKSLNSFA